MNALPLLRRLALALSATALGALALRAQPPPPAGRALFFTEPLYKGECLVVEAGGAADSLNSSRDARGRPFNDRIASVRLEGPVRAGLFEDSQFRGAFTWLTRDTPDLSALSLGSRSDRTWRTAVSSVQVQNAPADSSAFIAWTRRDAERAVRAAYRDIFSRDPDSSGLRTYVDRLLESGWTEIQLRDSLRRSDEFKSRDFNAILQRSYNEELGRPPDPSGAAAYQRGLSRGMTEAEVRAELRRSPEAGAHRAREAVTRAYREILRREPDPGGLDIYVKQITQKGWDEAKVRDTLRHSDEYRNLKR